MPPAQRRRPPPAQDEYLERIAQRGDPATDDAPQRQMRPGNARRRAPSTTIEPATATVSSKVKAYDYDETSNEVLENVEFPPGVEPASVSVLVGKTISLGAQSYEFLKIDVCVKLPCLPSKLNEAYEAASDFAAEKLVEEETKWLGQVKTKRTASRRS